MHFGHLIRVISLPFTARQSPTISCVKIINHQDSWTLFIYQCLEKNQDHTSHVVNAIPNSFPVKMKPISFNTAGSAAKLGSARCQDFWFVSRIRGGGSAQVTCQPGHGINWWKVKVTCNTLNSSIFLWQEMWMRILMAKNFGWIHK